MNCTLSAPSFRRAMGSFATGVTVVTGTSAGGERYGMTVNSFSSVSLDPMFVLVSLNAASRGLELIEDSGAFTINVLSREQEYLSRWFANRQRPSDSTMFDGVPISLGATGCPVIVDAAASFDCQTHRLVPAGDHVIVIGEVAALTHRADAEPLVFHAGDYRCITEATDTIERPQLHVA